MSTDFIQPNNREIVPASPAPAPSGKKLGRRKVFALAGGGTLVLVVGGESGAPPIRGCSAPARGRPTSRGTTGAQRAKDRSISCVLPFWRPIRITRNRGSST